MWGSLLPRALGFCPPNPFPEDHCFTNLDLSKAWMRRCTGWPWLWNIWEDSELRVSINNSFQVTRQKRIPAGVQAINWLLGAIKSWWMWKHVQRWKRHRFLQQRFSLHNCWDFSDNEKKGKGQRWLKNWDVTLCVCGFCVEKLKNRLARSLFSNRCPFSHSETQAGFLKILLILFEFSVHQTLRSLKSRHLTKPFDS